MVLQLSTPNLHGDFIPIISRPENGSKFISKNATKGPDYLEIQLDFDPITLMRLCGVSNCVTMKFTLHMYKLGERKFFSESVMVRKSFPQPEKLCHGSFLTVRMCFFLISWTCAMSHLSIVSILPICLSTEH